MLLKGARMRKFILGVILFFAALGPSFADSQGSITGGTMGTQSTAAGCVYQTSPATLSNNQQAGLRCGTDGSLNVNITGGQGGIVTADQGDPNGGGVASWPVIANAPLGITPTDRTITSATGSSQTVMAANASRHSLIIQNTGSSNCGINPTGGTAAIGGAGTLTLFPGGSYQPRIPTLSAVTAICTAAQPLYAEEN